MSEAGKLIIRGHLKKKHCVDFIVVTFVADRFVAHMCSVLKRTFHMHIAKKSISIIFLFVKL